MHTQNVPYNLRGLVDPPTPTPFPSQDLSERSDCILQVRKAGPEPVGDCSVTPCQRAQGPQLRGPGVRLCCTS